MSKKLEETLRKYNGNKTFLVVMAVFMCLMSFRFFAKELSSFNVTLYAFNYSYGFMSRGLIGTIWRGMDNILPGDQMTHEALFTFSAIITYIYILVMFVYFCVIIKRSSDKDVRNIRYLIILLSIFAIPIFGTRSNFGRIDLFLFIIVYICLMCIISEKAEWICIPLAIVAECIHQGFVFMNINIILVLFFYKIMKRTGRERKKYIILFAMTLLAASVFFLYFEFFSHVDGEAIYDEIVNTAKSLSYSGEAYSKMLVQHEILGQGVWMDEWRFHKANFVDVPIFVVLFLPYLIIGITFLKKLVKGKKELTEKLPYLAVALGALTVVPEMLLKVDFGRYVFAVFFYYITIVMCLIVMGDRHVANTFNDTKELVKSKIPFAIILVVYPIMFMPLYDVIISLVDSNISQLVTNGDIYVSR